MVDTGATSHMCCDKRLLVNIKTIDKHISITLSNGEFTSVRQLGTTQLSDKLSLHDCFPVPTFRYNLLYVSKCLLNSQLY